MNLSELHNYEYILDNSTKMCDFSKKFGLEELKADNIVS